MFLHQKFGYKTKFTDDPKDIIDMWGDTLGGALYFDTETTGLDVINDKPFLITLGVDKTVLAFEPNDYMLEAMIEIMKKAYEVFAHNVQFDYHMLTNLGLDLSEIDFADTMAVARLTQYADSLTRLSLESLGTEYVDPNAKASGKTIRTRMTEINRERKKELKEKFNERYPKDNFNNIFDKYKNRINYVEYDEDLVERFGFIEANFRESTYEDVYKKFPNLMINYAIDDVVIMIEYMDKASEVILQTDPDFKTFDREKELIPHICAMERIGFRADIDYLLSSREKVIAYRDKLYTNLHDITKKVISVGQHAQIKSIFEHEYGIFMATADEKALTYIVENAKNEDAVELARTIIELRTIDKWLSTYIDGKLNSIKNGRIYTSINNQGAVSGRVSSNLQQQPKYPLLDREGNELFHPRKVFLADENNALVFIDFSQMELRVQAYYTMLVSEGDLNLCRAYIPLKSHSFITGEEFDPKNREMLDRWDSGEWVLDDTSEIWSPIDLHSVTTFKAFPELNNDPNHPDFKKLRKLGKMCNFLKNYQGGVQAIIDQVGVSREIAENLDNAYYASFPNIRDYQNWVTRELTLHGFVENLYGRRYYMQDSKWFYKAGNYVIQGGCADLVKQKEIEVSEYLKDKKTNFVLPIHDELVFNVPKDEMYVIKDLQAIMQDNSDILKWIPMVSDIEITYTNWAEKEAYNG